MLVTDRADIADFARVHRNHGHQAIDGVVQFIAPGDNLRMTEMQGALGVVQMGRLSTLVAARSALAARYDTALAELDVTPQSRAPGAAVQSYVALTPDGVAAADVVRGLREREIEATIGTNAIPFTRYYEQRYGMVDRDLPATAMLRDRAVTLPLFPTMTTDEQDTVVASLAEVLR